jgi:hypothetical protein
VLGVPFVFFLFLFLFFLFYFCEGKIYFCWVFKIDPISLSAGGSLTSVIPTGEQKNTNLLPCSSINKIEVLRSTTALFCSGRSDRYCT